MGKLDEDEIARGAFQKGRMILGKKTIKVERSKSGDLIRPDCDQWGVPDWRNPAAYPSPTDEKDLFYWAWQFLRRNDDYRQFWTQSNLPPQGDETEALEAMRRKAARFGLHAPYPPDSETPPSFLTGSGIIAGSEDSTEELYLPANNCAYVFDLTLPLEPQFQSAIEHARFIQKGRNIKNSRVRDTDKYSLYIRIIDARNAKTKTKDIVAALFGGIENDYPDRKGDHAFSENKKSAIALRDGGYRKLINRAICGG